MDSTSSCFPELAALLPELKEAELWARLERHHSELEQRLGRPVAMAVAAADLAHVEGQLNEPVVLSATQYRELERRAQVDAKTGLYNYATFIDRLRDELGRAERYGHTLSVIMMDVDGLKALNDQRGHLAGDEAIVGLAEVLRTTLRTSDICGRFGGDEFAVIAPHTDALLARKLAERILEEGLFAFAELGVGLSLGIASWPDAGYTVGELLGAADDALYRAKRTGGNRLRSHVRRRTTGVERYRNATLDEPGVTGP